MPSSCSPRKEDATGAFLGGCPIWEDKKPTHEECKAFAGKGNACMFIDTFCRHCEQWNKGCNPAGKPKITARNRYLIKMYQAIEATKTPLSQKHGVMELPQWLTDGIALVKYTVDDERGKWKEGLINGKKETISY